MRTFVVVLLFSLLFGGRARAFVLRPEENIIFLGDTVTARGQFTVYVEAYLRTRFPTNTCHILNAARNGERVSSPSGALTPANPPPVYGLFSKNIVALQPTIVVTCFGMDDGLYAPPSTEYFARFVLGYAGLVDLIQNQTRARLVVMTPPNFDPVQPVNGPDRRPWETYGRQRPYTHYDQVLQTYSDYLIQAYKARAMIVDVHSRMKRHLALRRQSDPSFRLQDDGIDPNPTGQMIMALALLEAWQSPAYLDRIDINPLTPPQEGGPVSDFSNDDQGIAFKWKTQLPMPIDPLWDEKSVALENVKSRFYQLILRVTNLAPATYEIRVNDLKVGETSAGKLRRGIDLAQLDDFPLRKISLRVLNLIRQQRALGNAVWENQDSPERTKWLELDRQLKDLCRPQDMEVRLTVVSEDQAEKEDSSGSEE